MERFKARPWASAALAGSVLWTLICIYEVWVRQNGDFAPGPGNFFKLAETVQLAAFGIVGLAALAWLGEQVWRPARL
jgi:hypothetical protein